LRAQVYRGVVPTVLKQGTNQLVRFPLQVRAAHLPPVESGGFASDARRVLTY
jgi:hypothetical protein